MHSLVSVGGDKKTSERLAAFEDTLDLLVFLER